MRKKLVLFLSILLSSSMLFAQDNLSKLHQSYLQNKRDIKIVKEYHDALVAADKNKEAKEVLGEYMSRCPVIQIEDRDTYLLLNELLFQNPYDNEFEYATYAYKKLYWDRVDLEQKGDTKNATLKAMLKAFGRGISKADQVDKRFEAYEVIRRKLEREVNRLCVPSFKKDKYLMPAYDASKIDSLKYLIQRVGNLDVLLLKIANAKAINEGNATAVIRNMNVFTTVNSIHSNSNYFTEIMICASYMVKDKAAIKEALQCIEKIGPETYCSAASHYYFLVGDKVNGEKYKKIYDDLEASRMARFGDLFKSFE